MLEERQAGQEEFRSLLQTVVGQAFSAAGYEMEERPLQWAGGKYRFIKSFSSRGFGLIDFQALVYSDTMWSAGAPSRFTVHLTRSPDRAGRASKAAGYISRSLSRLVVADFGVGILPAADHWWTYRDAGTLGQALAEAGRLTIGYGMPWLAGELEPPSD